MVNVTHAYVIWYGTWTSAKTSIITSFLGSVGGSPYFNINTTYYNAAKTKVQNSVTFTGVDHRQLLARHVQPQRHSHQDHRRQRAEQRSTAERSRRRLLRSDEQRRVEERLPDLRTAAGTRTARSARPTSSTRSSAIPAGPKVSSCAAQTTSSPNGDVGADAMVSVIAHELEEAVTDPNLNAWYDNRGYENADKCAWTFGTTYNATNGSKANMNLGGHDYLIQRNWVNASGGYCSISY